MSYQSPAITAAPAPATTTAFPDLGRDLPALARFLADAEPHTAAILATAVRVAQDARASTICWSIGALEDAVTGLHGPDGIANALKDMQGDVRGLIADLLVEA